ncbi:hypothetical protein M0802_003103 [Mischocyttarus mexicanus]|nr:hypothetical protein M0802_003103 [Mischocyttarus mexicanus]
MDSGERFEIFLESSERRIPSSGDIKCRRCVEYVILGFNVTTSISIVHPSPTPPPSPPSPPPSPPSPPPPRRRRDPHRSCESTDR